ncbi:MAG: antirestriction protein ArdA [Bacteroidota bacterium]
MTNSYYAQPYTIEASGFYFKSYDDYLEKSKSLTDRYGEPVEEFEIQFIDGDNMISHLFRHLGITQGTLSTWFEEFESLAYPDLLAACYLTEEEGYNVNDLLNTCLGDIYFFEGDKEDYAHDYVEQCDLLSSLPEALQAYFDYKSFANDLVLNGDITEWLSPCGSRYVVTPL